MTGPDKSSWRLFTVKFAPQYNPDHDTGGAVYMRPVTRHVKGPDAETVEKFIGQQFPGAEILKIAPVTELHQETGGTWNVLKDPLLPSP